jgi:hypothetical protein
MTADFDCSRSGSFKTDLGLRLRLFFAILEFCIKRFQARRKVKEQAHLKMFINLRFMR